MPKAKTVEDIDFEMDKDGELNLSGFDDDDEFDFDSADEVEDDEEEESNEDEDEEDSDEDESEEEEEEEEEKSDPVDVLREEFSDFKKSIPNIVAQSVAMSLAAVGLTGKKKGKDDDDDDDDEEEEELTSKQLLKRLEKKIDTSVDSAVNGKFGKYQAAMDEAEVTRQFREGVQKHGAPLMKNMQSLAIIMRDAELKGPDAVEKAWRIFRRLNPKQREKLRVPSQKTQKALAKKKPDADSDDVVTKRPERTPFKKFKGTDADVFDKAAESAIISHMKKRR